MKINLEVYSGKDMLNNDIYWHITARAEGLPEDEPRIKETLTMLWDRLSAGHKSYARKTPRITAEREFESNGVVVRGHFRLTTTAEQGDLIAPATTYDDTTLFGFVAG